MYIFSNTEEDMPKRKTIDKEYQDLVNVDLHALKENAQNFLSNFPDPR
jgi:hypothetical protein